MAATTETPTPQRGAESKAARRVRMVEAAMYLAAEGGYEAVQMRAVAEQANVSLGTIYRYFAGKDDMLLAGLAGWIHLLRRRIEDEPFSGGSAADRLAEVLGQSASAAEGAPVLMGALVTALSTTDSTAAQYKLQIDSEVSEMIVVAIGDEPGIDAVGISRVVGHVWLSAISRWVGGLAEAGSVEAELRHAVKMLIPARNSG
jgi:AcrR family transcriptional regulator